MKLVRLAICFCLVGAIFGLSGCGSKEEKKESGFDNTKPVPAEDGGGAKS